VRQLAFASALFAVCASVSSASTQRQPPLVGSYWLVTRIQTPFRASAPGSISIDTYNPSTGAITGHGYDDSETAPLSMTGTVHGSTLTMRVVNRYGVASDHGIIYPNGTIRGTITAKAGNVTERGTWTMTPFELVVRKAGFSLEHFGHQFTDVTWGAVLENVSKTRDALEVRTVPDALTKAGRVVSGQLGLVSPRTRVIPAGDAIYIGGDSSLTGWIQVARVRVSITEVSSRPTKRYRLPPVSDIRIDRAQHRVTGTLTNPYATRISTYDYWQSAVFYDRGGHVIGGSDDGDIGDLSQSQWIKPGGRASVALQIPDQIVGRVASARITVLPE
jgi:hypothetical protein